MKTLKHATVEAMFPELKGAHIYKTGRGRASDSKAAITRAFADLFSQVKGKRIQVVKATITIVSMPVERAALIHARQYLCPKRHAILAQGWDDRGHIAVEMEEVFRRKVEHLHRTGTLRRRCNVCAQDVPLHFEDGVTQFRTMEEAAPHLAAMQARQWATRQMLKAGRN